MAKKGRRPRIVGTGLPKGIITSTGSRGIRHRSVRMTPKPLKGTRSTKKAKAFEDQQDNS